MSPATLLLCGLLLGSRVDVVELKGGSIVEGTIEAHDGVGVTLRVAPDRVLFFAPRDVAAVRRAVEEIPPPEFMRFREGTGSAADALQSGVATYLDPKSLRRVTLVGAVHVGDEAYYAGLQKILDAHEVVLFEGVGAGASVEDMEQLSFIGGLQIQMGKLLDLRFQKDGIDYKRPSFKNADMTWAEMQTELKRRDQTLIPMEGLLRLVSPFLTRMMAAQTAMLEQSGQKEEAAAEMKRAIARMLANAPALLTQMGMHDAEKRDDVIISARNDAALRILDDTLKTGAKSIAIFYGAGHLPDMDRRLRAIGFERRSLGWIDAWRIPKPKKLPK